MVADEKPVNFVAGHRIGTDKSVERRGRRSYHGTARLVAGTVMCVHSWTCRRSTAPYYSQSRPCLSDGYGVAGSSCGERDADATVNALGQHPGRT